MRYALESLPWVAKGSVESDIQRQRVRFAVTDRQAFKVEQARQVINKAGFRTGNVIAGP